MGTYNEQEYTLADNGTRFVALIIDSILAGIIILPGVWPLLRVRNNH